MHNLGFVIIFSLAGGVFSLIGGFLLFADEKHIPKMAAYAASFAAGALLSVAFLDLLKEASHEGSIDTALLSTLIGILVFFLLERFVTWFHHHHVHKNSSQDPAVPLVMIGDSIHNFIDGVAIAAAFIVDVPTGIIVALAVSAHEIPHKIGDFGLLLHKGMTKRGVVIFNVVSASITTVGAVIFYVVGQTLQLPLDVILGLTAGFFIYIAVSDIIPDIHESENKSFAGPQTALLLSGVLIVGIMTTYLDGLIKSQTTPSVQSDSSHSTTQRH